MRVLVSVVQFRPSSLLRGCLVGVVSSDLFRPSADVLVCLPVPPDSAVPRMFCRCCQFRPRSALPRMFFRCCQFRPGPALPRMVLMSVLRSFLSLPRMFLFVASSAPVPPFRGCSVSVANSARLRASADVLSVLSVPPCSAVPRRFLCVCQFRSTPPFRGCFSTSRLRAFPLLRGSPFRRPHTPSSLSCRTPSRTCPARATRNSTSSARQTVRDSPVRRWADSP
jgi:hypothetical protein